MCRQFPRVRNRVTATVEVENVGNAYRIGHIEVNQKEGQRS
jgi:hypothetical protein